MILPQSLLDDLSMHDTPRASPPSVPLQVDTSLPNHLRSGSSVSPTRAEREAMIMKLNNQARLIELHRRILLAQSAYDTNAAASNLDDLSSSDQDASELMRLQYELQTVQMRLNRFVDPAASKIPTPPLSKPSSALVIDPQRSAASIAGGIATSSLHDRMASDSSTLVEDMPYQLSGPQTLSPLSAEYAPLGDSIWRRVTEGSFASSPFKQQQPASSNGHEFASILPSRKQTSTSLAAVAYDPRKHQSNGVNGSLSPDRDQKFQPRGADSSTGSGPTSSQLSVHSSEFIPVSIQQQSTYVTLTEPINYRQLLERAVNCNWKYIVDKIVNNNDQQASIFLQQKLKIGTQEQKYEIIEAIVDRAYPLMVNRFGNFLVQRCFEHGTPEQIDEIADTIKGNVLDLSMDAFGCHVVQKALDCVGEDVKAEMVMELLRRVADTVVHRYACHVWQKLFELRWEGTPPAIMTYVNRELRGMWTQVALGETGSLVVQNIFENCVEEDKRPCIEEVLDNINVIARGQWGNWVIQHMIEHGGPKDSERALDMIIQNAVSYSMDQFASKVIEKVLKHSPPEVIDRYLAKICEGRLDRPRIPLIDSMSRLDPDLMFFF